MRAPRSAIGRRRTNAPVGTRGRAGDACVARPHEDCGLRRVLIAPPSGDGATNVRQPWPNSAETCPTLTALWPNLVNILPNPVNIDRPYWAQVCPTIAAEIGLCAIEVGLILTRIGTNADLCRTLLDLIEGGKASGNRATNKEAGGNQSPPADAMPRGRRLKASDQEQTRTRDNLERICTRQGREHGHLSRCN